MKRYFMLGTVWFAALMLISMANTNTLATTTITNEALTDGYIDFENGVDGQPIQSSIPGLQFTTTTGYDWVYADWRTGNYNGPYPNGAYYSNGNFFAWLGPNQGAGRIDFTQGCAGYLQVWVSSESGLYADGYNTSGTLIATASVPGNLNTGQMERLRIDAPSGTCLSYVILHDTGNFWLIDDLSTDASGVPSTRPPVVFLPGLMGSVLRNNDTCVNEDDEVWPAPLSMIHPFDPHLDHLRLATDGVTPASNCDHIYVDGVIEEILTLDFYEPLIDYLDNTANFDVYPFAYDWRLDLTGRANQLDSFINNILAQTGASQVNIVDHSLGGLLARYYVVSSPARAAKVEQVVSLGTPFLGAPKSLVALRWGDNIPMEQLGGIGLLYAPRVQALVQNAPAFYQILPSQRYFNVNGGGYYAFGGAIFGWSQTKTLIQNQHNQQLAIGAEAFHSAAMDDWGSISTGVAFRLIVGSGVESTPGIIHEYQVKNWLGHNVLKFDVININGDGTVPLHSADLQGNGYDYSGGVPIWYAQNLDHLALAKQDYVLSFIAAMLATPPNPLATARAEITHSHDPSAQTIYAGPPERFGQATHDQDAPPTPPEMGDQPFPLNGGQITTFGTVNLHVYDSSGNHTGPVAGTDRIDLDVPGSGYTVAGSATFVTVPVTGTYTIMIESDGAGDFDLRVRNVEGIDTDLIQRTVTYMDAPIGMIGVAQLLYDPDDPAPAPSLAIDVDGNGTFDQYMPPTSDIGPSGSDDVTPPVVSIDLNGQIGPHGWYVGDVVVTITASDDNSGIAKIDYTINYGQSIQVYNGPFTVPAEQVSLLVVKATDNAGNEAWTVAQVGPSKTYFPAILRP